MGLHLQKLFSLLLLLARIQSCRHSIRIENVGVAVLKSIWLSGIGQACSPSW